MALDSRIAMSGQIADLVTPIKEYRTEKRAQRQEARQAQAFDQGMVKVKIDNMTARDRSRLESSVQGLGELGVRLESGGVDSAREFLIKRRQDIGSRIAAGEDVDVTQTDEAISMLDQDPESLKRLIESSNKFGRAAGILKSPNQAAVGGATGVLIDRLMSENPSLTVGDALFQIQSGARQGLSSQGGVITPISGFGESRAATEQQIAGGKERGKLTVAGELRPKIEGDVSSAKKRGSEIGADIVSLERQEAMMPQLERTVSILSDLGKRATYTEVGQAKDSLARQMGFDVGIGAEARVEYISTIDNQILPLLRQTFGAAFTEKEGQSLKATLGNPDLSSSEKDASLKSFIRQKTENINALRSQLGKDTKENPVSNAEATSMSDDELSKMLGL